MRLEGLGAGDGADGGQQGQGPRNLCVSTRSQQRCDWRPFPALPPPTQPQRHQSRPEPPPQSHPPSLPLPVRLAVQPAALQPSVTLLPRERILQRQEGMSLESAPHTFTYFFFLTFTFEGDLL